MNKDLIELLMEKYEECKKRSDNDLSEILHIMTQNYAKAKIINVCQKTHEANEILNHIEQAVFDEEDRHYYNYLLERKPISHNFNPSNRKRVEAIATIVSVI